MEDIVRTEGAEDALHAGAAADAGNHHLRVHLRELAGHHETDVVLRGFRLVYQEHFGRFERRHLTHDFHADRAGGTGDKDAFPGEHFLYGLHVHADFLAGQEVFHAHLFELDIL